MSPEAQILQPEDTKKGVCGEEPDEQIQRRISERVPKEVPKRDISRDGVQISRGMGQKRSSEGSKTPLLRTPFKEVFRHLIGEGLRRVSRYPDPTA